MEHVLASLGPFALDTVIKTMIRGSFWNLMFLKEGGRGLKEVADALASGWSRPEQMARVFSILFYFFRSSGQWLAGANFRYAFLKGIQRKSLIFCFMYNMHFLCVL